VGYLFIYFAKWPIGTFLTQGDETILTHVINYVSLVGWTVIAWSVFSMLQSIFESFQKTSFTFWINVFRLWGVRIPGVLMCTYFFSGLQEYGVWYTMFFSNIITLIFALAFFAIKIPHILDSDKTMVIA